MQGKGWVAAKDLHINDKLKLQNGEDAFVDEIGLEQLDTPVQVFNFEVEDFHTYFVGSNGVLVHNLCAKARREGVRKAWAKEKTAVQNVLQNITGRPNSVPS